MKRMMTKLMLTMLALIAVMVSGCSNSAEVEAELKAMYNKVPSDAAVVISGDLRKMVEQSGGKVADDGRIEWKDDKSMGAIASMDNLQKMVENLRPFADGIEAGGFVVFMEKGQPYGIFKVRDLSVIKAAIDRRTDATWEKSGKIEHKAEYYITDNGEYLWLAPHASMSTIEEWQSLSEIRSFAGNEYAAKMSASDDAINIWASLDALYSTLSFSQQAQARMAVSMLFEQPKYITGHANYDKDGFRLEAMPMTADYKPAKCVIEVSKIDPAAVGGLEGNANVVMAVNISQKLVGQIKDFGRSMGGAVPQEIWSLISPLDGTMAIAADDAANLLEGYKAVVTTNGREDAALAQFLGGYGNVNIQGKTLTLSKGNFGSGKLVVADVAKRFGGAWLGVAAADYKGSKITTYILLEPKDGTLGLTVICLN